jgi:hypothetical protein
MAICRFGSDSDVYVYYCVTGGISCQRCHLTPGVFEFKASNEGEMIAHLEQHRAAGHAVPDEAFVALRNPQL